MGETAPLGVILNPAASGGKGARLKAAVESGLRERGLSFSLRLTREPGHARELAREMARAGTERILVVGGDGTIHEVANGILEGGGRIPEVAVGPVGTGNDFYRMVGAPRNMDAALDLLTHGRVERLDVGRARFGGEEIFFVNLLGLGLDVEVLRRRSGFRRLSGLPQYLAALVATLVSFRSFHLDIGFTGESPSLSAATILAGMTLGPSIGGGFMISPKASPRDGLLDFFFVEPLGPVKVARYIPKVLRGTHGDLPEFNCRQVEGARFSRSDGKPFFFEVDGELMPNAVKTLEVEIRPRALPVVLSGGPS